MGPPLHLSRLHSKEKMGRLSDRNRFYGLIIALCAAGYIWLFLGMQADGFSPEGRQELPGVCIFKHATTIPCPSCGSTRSVLHILHGDFRGGLYWNPLGFILLVGLIIAPVWIAHDLLRRKNSLHISFRRMEIWLRKWWVALPAIVLVLANWVWNLVKGY